jgi:hypothetical protein
MVYAERDVDLESRAGANLALDSYGTAVQFDELLNQGEADPGSLERSAFLVFDAMKTFEKSWKLVHRDSGSGISHHKFGAPAVL